MLVRREKILGRNSLGTWRLLKHGSGYSKSFVRTQEQSMTAGLLEPVLSDFLLTIPKSNAKIQGYGNLSAEIIVEIKQHHPESDEKRTTGKGKHNVKSIDILDMLQALWRMDIVH